MWKIFFKESKMATNNNLIRPPVLSNNHPQPTVEMSNQISELVNRLVDARLGQRANPTIEVDQTITLTNGNNIGELDKIPDVVRSLREFSGEPREFSSWKKSVERIIQIYEPICGTPKYFGILSVIRNKITGQADAALESYNTPLNWKAICKCLTLHYADKRDLGTLEYQMNSLLQGRLTTQEFYQSVYSHLSLILNKISCMDMSHETLCIMTQTYRDKALDTFIRGLNGDLPKLLGMREPVDLPQALHLCLKLENQYFRTNYAYGVAKNLNNPSLIHPAIPPRNHNNRISTNSKASPYFYPELAYLPQPPRNPNPTPNPGFGYNHYNNPNNFKYDPVPPPRPSGPKPPKKPEPMEVDQSAQTRRINYMNRPMQNNTAQGKRPASTQIYTDKRQRNYNIETQDYEDVIQNNEEAGQSLHDYVYPSENLEDNYQPEHDSSENIDFTDIHFLE